MANSLYSDLPIFVLDLRVALRFIFGGSNGFFGYFMRLNQIHKSGVTDSWRQVFLLWCLLACVFASCSIHASNMFDQSMDAMMMQDQMHADEHDCCDEEQQCCDKPDGVTNLTMVDLPTAHIGYTVEIPSTLNLRACLSQQLISHHPPTGPPIHLLNCRFTI